MRWLLALCALGTAAMLHAARVEPPSGIRGARVVAEWPPKIEREVRAPSAPPPPLPTEPAAVVQESKRPPPAEALVGESAVARGVLVDETGAHVPAAEIRGMDWRHRRGSTYYEIEGYARDGVFVFRYSSVFPWRPPLDQLTLRVAAPGFVHERFVVPREATAALLRAESVEGLTIVLQRGAIVEGTVRGPDGRPTAGIDVGVVHDPLADRPDWRTRQSTDEHGWFRLVDLDPRRRLWLYTRNRKLIARPLPLPPLHATTVTSQSLFLQHVTRTEVLFEMGTSDSIRIDCRRGFMPMEAGRYRTVLKSGPHRCAFKNAEGDVIKKIRLWIEPHERERHVLVLD